MEIKDKSQEDQVMIARKRNKERARSSIRICNHKTEKSKRVLFYLGTSRGQGVP